MKYIYSVCEHDFEKDLEILKYFSNEDNAYKYFNSVIQQYKTKKCRIVYRHKGLATIGTDKYIIVNKCMLEDKYNFISDDGCVIGLAGKKHSGKDTVGEYLVKEHGFVRVAFADTVKEACKIIFGFTDEQVYGDLKETVDDYWNITPRKILQTVGTDLFRIELPNKCPNISNDIWIKSVDKQIKNLLEKGQKKIVITDVRFQNEFDYIKQNNGFVWKITRPSITNKDKHKSENMVDLMLCDAEITNDGTINELHNKIDNII